MSLLPKSPKARRRLSIVAVAAPILSLAAGLALYGLRNTISYFYTPAQARAAHVAPGQAMQLGGLVMSGSVRRNADGTTKFVVADRVASAPVIFRGDLPDLFRDGQGVVAIGYFDTRGEFIATTILAKHDERYMPQELARALKARGEWRGDGAIASYGQPATGPS